QAGALPGVVADRHPRSRARDTGRSRTDPMEVAHGPSCGGPGLCGPEAGLVCLAVEAGDVSQGPEIGLPGRALQAPHSGAANQPAGRSLRRRLAGVLVDDGEPREPRSPGRERPDEGRDRAAGSNGWEHDTDVRDADFEADGLALPRTDREA